MALAITTGGQLSIRWIEQKLNGYMNKILKTGEDDYVIASDTDSIYLSLDKLVQVSIAAENPTATKRDIVRYLDVVCEKKIQPFIDRSYQELADYVNAYDQKMQMKREALADAAIWTAKKRYIVNVWNNEGVEYEKPKIKVMGLEVQKSSTPSSCREKLREAISVIINGTEEDIQKFIAEYREEFKTLPLPEISFPRSVNGLGKYHDDRKVYGFKTPMHVRGALFYNNLIRKNDLTKSYELIKEGDKIKFIQLKEPNPIGSDCIAYVADLPKELDLHQYIDYNEQFEKAFVEPLKIILNQIGWKTKKVNSLKGFMKK